MRVRPAVSVALLLLLAPATALAGPWYYRWVCTGLCASGPYQGFDGREGPFASYEDCDYARTRDGRDRGPRPYTLMFCEEVRSSSGAPPVVVAPAASASESKVHLAAREFGIIAGPGWSARSDTGTTTGAWTFGLEVDGHAGRDFGGASLQIGIQGTKLEAPLLGSEPQSWYAIPVAVGLVLSPQVYESGDTRARLDLGASFGGFYELGCSTCPGQVFQDSIGYGYTLKAGVDLYLDRNAGVSLDVIIPRYSIGSADPGNLELTSPKWMVRASLIDKPAD